MNYDMAPRSPSPLPAKRVRRLTERMKALLADTLPEGPGPLADPADHDLPRSPSPEPDPLRIRVRRVYKTLRNAFGISRTYIGRPTAVPDSDVTFGDMVNEDLRPTAPTTKTRQSVRNIIFPYPNLSAFKFNMWHWNGGGKKTKAGRKELLNEVLLDESFNLEDLRGVNFEQLDKEIAENPTNGEEEGNGWSNRRVYIDIPSGQKATKASKKKQAHADAAANRQRAAGAISDDSESEDDATLGKNTMRYPVPEFHYRKLTRIIEEACSSEASKTYHWHPYEEHWQPPWENAGQEHIHGELYASKAFQNADRELQNSPREPGCDLPRVILAMMGWSDATHVAQFGQAKLWPHYWYFGNQSKYDRCRPSAQAAYHGAYFPSVRVSVLYVTCKYSRIELSAS